MTDRKRLIILLIANVLLAALLYGILYLTPLATAMPCGDECRPITKPTATQVYIAPPATEEPSAYPAPPTATQESGYPVPEPQPEPTEKPDPEATHPPTATPPDPSKD